MLNWEGVDSRNNVQFIHAMIYINIGWLRLKRSLIHVTPKTFFDTRYAIHGGGTVHCTPSICLWITYTFKPTFSSVNYIIIPLNRNIN